MSAPDFRADIDREQIAAALRHFEFVGGNVDDAMRIAINKTAPKIRTLSSVKIREQVRLSAAYVKDKLTIRRATRAKLSAAISTPKRGLLLTKFSTDAQAASDGIRWLRPPAAPPGGIRVKVKPGGATKKVSPGAGSKPFYIVLRDSGALGIARRNSRHRNDIDVLHGPSLSQVFRSVRGDVTPEAGAELTRQMQDAMRYILQQRSPPEPPNE